MARETAWRVLRSGSETPMREVEWMAEEAGLDGRDRGLVRKIVGTEVRRRGSLRALVKYFADGKPNPDIAAHLRIGLTQLFFLDQVPPHAAVSETVRATTDTLGQSKGRYVNAVLRSALRARREGHSGDARHDLVGRPWHLDEPIFHNPEEHPYLWAEDALSIPAALMKRWVKRWGREEAEALARIYLEEPEVSVRLRGDDATAEATATELAGGQTVGVESDGAGASEESCTFDGASVPVEAAELESEDGAAGLELRAGGHSRVRLLPTGSLSRLIAHPAFVEGRVTIQGETALRAAELVGAQAGERILDLCAAPGGKTAVMLDAGARVLAVDSSEHRLATLESGLERLGFEPGQVETCVSDGTAEIERVAVEGSTIAAEALAAGGFDAVLVDAPCSNTGVLGARPGARWRFGPGGQRSLAELQERLLREAAALVRPGGRLVYSTCSIEPEENCRRVRSFLEEVGGFVLESEHEALPAAAGGAGPVDGGYGARLRREG